MDFAISCYYYFRLWTLLSHDLITKKEIAFNYRKTILLDAFSKWCHVHQHQQQIAARYNWFAGGRRYFVDTKAMKLLQLQYWCLWIERNVNNPHKCRIEWRSQGLCSHSEILIASSTWMFQEFVKVWRYYGDETANFSEYKSFSWSGNSWRHFRQRIRFPLYAFQEEILCQNKITWQKDRNWISLPDIRFLQRRDNFVNEFKVADI